MAQQVTMDRDRTAGIIMDFQNRIVNTAARDPQAVVKNAALVLAGARRAGIPVIHVVHRGGAYKEVSLDTEVHAGVAPAPGGTMSSTRPRQAPFPPPVWTSC